MAWSFTADRPVYIQVAERIRRRVITGEYKAGAQIPSVRQIAMEATVNPNTVQRALVELETEGLLEARGTLGRFVTEDESVIERGKQSLIRSLVKSFITDAMRLGLTKEQIEAAVKEGTDERT
ncbi:MAG: GntR family transcriptional regulator [Clostridia bacterium]|nr:GntR family transcriptional regulator [Clostridia bacterium]